MPFRQIKVVSPSGCLLTYYTDMQVECGDRLVVETRSNELTVLVHAIGPPLSQDPFKASTGNGKNKPPRAHCRVLRNLTTSISADTCDDATRKGAIVMTGYKVVEVKHMSSDRKGLFMMPDVYPAFANVGDLVVYEEQNYSSKSSQTTIKNPLTNHNMSVPALHVGVVTNTDIDVASASNLLICRVDMLDYCDYKEREKRAAALRKRLDEMRKRFQEVDMFRIMAETNPQAAALYNEYMQLVAPGTPMITPNPAQPTYMPTEDAAPSEDNSSVKCSNIRNTNV